MVKISSKALSSLAFINFFPRNGAGATCPVANRPASSSAILSGGNTKSTHCDAMAFLGIAGYFADALARLQPLADDGLVRIGSDRIVVTPRGRLLLRNIAMCFDRYLEQPATVATPRFSRAI